MKGRTIAICFCLVSALPASAQEQPFHLLRGHITEGQHAQPSYTWELPIQGTLTTSNPGKEPEELVSNPTNEPLKHKSSRLQKLGHGFAHAVRAAGKISDAVAVEVLEAMLSAPAYVPPPTVTQTSEYQDSCVHGYTPSTCPYGYYGSSYGSPYISGSGDMRMRPDAVGGYRFYTSRGVSGSLRPDYMGGYQMQVYP